MASPLGDELSAALEAEGAEKTLGVDADGAARARLLVQEHGWETKHAKKVLGFGPDGRGANVLVDATVGVQGVDGVVEHLLSAFEQLCSSGPLCAERLRGVRIDLVDAKIHAEAAQRRAPQVAPAAKRGMAAALLAAQPLLLEPMHSVTLRAPLGLVGEAYDELSLRRADDLSHEQHEGGVGAREAPCVMSGALPLTEAGGLTEALRGRLHGQASGLALAFSHWRPLEGEPWKAEAGAAGAAVAAIRARKKLGAGPATAEAVGDKL